MSISRVYSYLVLFGLLSCARHAVPASDNDGCIPIADLQLSKKQMAVITPALLTRVDTRRVKFSLNRFCGYEKPTSNGKFKILTVYQNGVNHVSQNWFIISANQAIDTKLSCYQMVTDSIGMQKLIDTSVTKLTDADDATKQELLQTLTKESRFYRKQGIVLGSQKSPN